MPAIVPRSTNSGSSDSILQHFYFIAAVALILILFLLRIISLRRRNQALSDFFRIGGSSSRYAYGSYPPNDSNHGSMIHGIQLTAPPAAYRPDRRVHAADVDAHGRRLGPTGEGWEGKDELPAYDNFDRPPKYVEAGWSHGSHPPPAEPSASAAAPSNMGEQSGALHPSTPDGAPGENSLGQPPDDTHAVAGVVRRSEAPLPVHDSPHS